MEIMGNRIMYSKKFLFVYGGKIIFKSHVSSKNLPRVAYMGMYV
jgi:hypothetical protein